MEVLVEYLLPLPSCIFSYPISLAHEIQAYIDPGTGSLVIQFAIGALAGGLVAIRVFWGRIRKWLGKTFSRSHAPDESDHVDK